MTDVKSEVLVRPHLNTVELKISELRFGIFFTPGTGATIRVYGVYQGNFTELARFDDFLDNPHYHAPATGDEIPFDSSLGDPLAWFVDVIGNHLKDILVEAGFESVLPSIDFKVLARNSNEIYDAVVRCIPNGYVQVPNVGLQKAV